MTNGLRNQLLEALKALALPSDRQLERVKAFGVGIDELALEFDDAARTRGRLVAEGDLSHEQALAVARVHAQLRKITAAGARRWTDEAVRTGEDWSELRRLAEAAVATMA